ncbi:hypothetical protein BGW80DRAFT_1360468 [Lactifluus volemus]|nr:hypothetical protein BGW80DRAFT_1360468 [Lactifluus volemus]
MPIFFVHKNKVDLGLSLIHATAGDCGMLLGALTEAPVGTCSSMYVRIKWPGYDDWYSQILTKDQTQTRTTISLEKLAKRVAIAVCKLLDEAAQMDGHDPAWRVGGYTGIRKEDVNLIGLVQVSQGSWQPILQLNRWVLSDNRYILSANRSIMSGSGDHVGQALSAPTGEIERSMSSTSVHDTQTDSDLHLDNGMGPYITAKKAYSHALRMETQLQAIFATIGFSDEYVLQVGFNETALREGLLVEEIYLSVNGDLPTFNDHTVCKAFASVFTPFPGVVYTREHIDYLPVDPPAHRFRHLSSLGGFKVRTASSSTSTGAEGKWTVGRDEGGESDRSGKGKSREDRSGAGRGMNEGGDNDDGGDDPDPEEPGGGCSSRKPGFYITLMPVSKILIGPLQRLASI